MNICRICTGDVETDVELANQQEVGMQVGRRRVEQAPDLEMRILVQMLQTRLQGVALPRCWIDFEMLNAKWICPNSRYFSRWCYCSIF